MEISMQTFLKVIPFGIVICISLALATVYAASPNQTSPGAHIAANNTFDLFFLFNILPSIVTGLVASAIFGLSVYNWQKPRVKLKAEPSMSSKDDTRHFYKLRAYNNGLTTAYHCKADVRIRGRTLHKPMSVANLKWVESPEPKIPILLKKDISDSGAVIDITHRTLLHRTWFIDIPPKSSQLFDLLMKDPGENYCYVFNGENYVEANNLKMESRKLSQGQYIADVKLTGDNVDLKSSFLISNRGPRIRDLSILPFDY
jgi:hypothetical protein